MPDVRRTGAFDDWLRGLRDIQARARIARRIDRLGIGDAGDVKSVGDGVIEIRIDHGPGYRVYVVRRGGEVIILLCGGDKGSQDRDIERAKAIARTV